jgi:hypothetical protein
MTRLRRLWQGDLPLAEAFWHWAVLGGLLVNVSTTAGFLALVVADRLIEAFIVGYVFSVPYNFVVAVGVWRSAGRYTGDPGWAAAARIVTVAGMIVLSIT